MPRKIMRTGLAALCASTLLFSGSAANAAARPAAADCLAYLFDDYAIGACAGEGTFIVAASNGTEVAISSPITFQGHAATILPLADVDTVIVHELDEAGRKVRVLAEGKPGTAADESRVRSLGKANDQRCTTAVVKKRMAFGNCRGEGAFLLFGLGEDESALSSPVFYAGSAATWLTARSPGGFRAAVTAALDENGNKRT
ncbi:hypothetical protein GCM10010123_22240 [Pilimelia anulata]|uniref:Uncharacterized protein n=1 Tax=Pilimelia anulata TaxID=53371 RepID=A0A8J3BA09_9ACTN|nr:hypothetical protein [Pilimelia anulata]GGJ91981.1 hypothetical protein GCM10010123_22240 [Pilimelia anulata]